MSAAAAQHAFAQGPLRCNKASARHASLACAAAQPEPLNRRHVLGATGCVLLSTAAGPAAAIQGSTAGRIPGLMPDPELENFRVYQRPAGKSGGHGVGWSEIPRYQFRVPAGWEESPVSIADGGGTEIDVRFGSRTEGSLQVVVAPVLRFRDVGYNSNVDMEFLGTPDLIIGGFAPELYGRPLDDGELVDTQVYKKDGNLYYQWALKPHRLVVATATGNRLFVLATASNSAQWKRGSENLQRIVESFYVPPVVNTFSAPVVKDTRNSSNQAD